MKLEDKITDFELSVQEAAENYTNSAEEADAFETGVDWLIARLSVMPQKEMVDVVKGMDRRISNR